MEFNPNETRIKGSDESRIDFGFCR